MWGPEYYYFDLPVINIGGVRRNVFNRWTVIAAVVAAVLVGGVFAAVVARPTPTKDLIVWGATVDPTSWELDGLSAQNVTATLLDNRLRVNTQVRNGTSRQEPTVTVPVGQPVVVAAKYTAGGYKIADDNGVFNMQCAIQPGGSVRMIGQHDDQVLVGYSPPIRSAKPDGTCTGKEVFYLELGTA